ncbi:MAG: hypothetical protein WCG83_01905, partial [Candidatus Peregrinibacteria bacterium]
MKHSPALIGSALTLAFLSGISPIHAADFRIYERLKVHLESEAPAGKADSQLRDFLVGVAKGEHITITPEDADAIAAGQLQKFCQSGRRSLTDCPTIFQSLSTVAAETRRFQALGRSLLLTAESNELGSDGFQGEPLSFSLRLPGIVRLWQGGTDVISTPIRAGTLRIAQRPAAVTDDLFNQISNTLLKDEQNVNTDAVWRYRYGVASFLDGSKSCNDQAGNGELQQLTVRRWCSIENTLQSLRDALPASAGDYDPPLTPGESALFPEKALEGAAHVIVWMKAKNVLGTVVRDVGLSWDVAIDPVLPSLVPEPNAPDCLAEMQSDPYCSVVKDLHIIPGGLYPDAPAAPKDSEGLCNLPLNALGYLCRPQERESCHEQNMEDDSDPRAIRLTSCVPSRFTEPTNLTTSGPDICRIGWWKTSMAETDPLVADTPGKDAGRVPNTCGQCAVDVVCGSCPEGRSAASPKDENGTIKICLHSGNPPTQLRYDLLRELVHAQQFCSLAPNLTLDQIVPDAAHCCANEREAYAVMCKAMAQDGKLQATGYSIDECASALANLRCTKFGANACSPLSGDDVNTVLRKVWNQSEDTPAASCEDLVTNMQQSEPRALAMEENLKNSCSPGCRSRYENTIGNNLCMLGQCTEQMTEESRLIPGRTGLISADESYPWDACIRPDPRNASLTLLPVIAPPPIPSYSPAALIESLDRALCQVSGLPASMPPVLCAFAMGRLLSDPPVTFAALGLSLGNQITEQKNPMEALRLMMPSIAVRLGVQRT